MGHLTLLHENVYACIDVDFREAEVGAGVTDVCDLSLEVESRVETRHSSVPVACLTSATIEKYS